MDYDAAALTHFKNRLLLTDSAPRETTATVSYEGRDYPAQVVGISGNEKQLQLVIQLPE